MALTHQPLVNKAEVVAYLKAVARLQTPIIEVSDVYPSADDTVAYGLYVEDTNTSSRTVNQLAVQNCGSMYDVVDQFSIMFISYQNDKQALVILDEINKLAGNTTIFDGYLSVEYDRSVTIGNRSEIHIYTFNLTRLEFNNATT